MEAPTSFATGPSTAAASGVSSGSTGWGMIRIHRLTMQKRYKLRVDLQAWERRHQTRRVRSLQHCWRGTQLHDRVGRLQRNEQVSYRK